MFLLGVGMEADLLESVDCGPEERDGLHWKNYVLPWRLFANIF